MVGLDLDLRSKDQFDLDVDLDLDLDLRSKDQRHLDLDLDPDLDLRSKDQNRLDQLICLILILILIWSSLVENWSKLVNLFENDRLRPKLLHMRFARATVAGPPGSNRPVTLFISMFFQNFSRY